MSALMAPPSYRLNQRKNVSSRYASVGLQLAKIQMTKVHIIQTMDPQQLATGRHLKLCHLITPS